MVGRFNLPRNIGSLDNIAPMIPNIPVQMTSHVNHSPVPPDHPKVVREQYRKYLPLACFVLETTLCFHLLGSTEDA